MPQALASAIAKKIERNLLVMEASVNNPQDCGQRISNGSRFSAEKKQDRCVSAPHIARKKRCLGRVMRTLLRKLSLVERGESLRYNRAVMLDMFLGCLKW